ncbi:chorismate-binding protein [Brochothrix campestris]|uniref:chorismate-binding protein n=1 Tax=Brochothrix campestris TaxID=2757 RepID=UPI0038BC9A2E
MAQEEPQIRGFFGAPIGWYDASENGEFAVGIRSLVAANQQVRLFAGCGIVADSEPQTEWNETALKFQPMLRLLGGAHNDKTSN